MIPFSGLFRETLRRATDFAREEKPLGFDGVLRRYNLANYESAMKIRDSLKLIRRKAEDAAGAFDPFTSEPACDSERRAKSFWLFCYFGIFIKTDQRTIENYLDSLKQHAFLPKDIDPLKQAGGSGL